MKKYFHKTFLKNKVAMNRHQSSKYQQTKKNSFKIMPTHVIPFTTDEKKKPRMNNPTQIGKNKNFRIATKEETNLMMVVKREIKV